MRGKSIWNIWTRIKWEAKLTNLNWPPSMDLNLHWPALANISTIGNEPSSHLHRIENHVNSTLSDTWPDSTPMFAFQNRLLLDVARNTKWNLLLVFNRRTFSKISFFQIGCPLKQLSIIWYWCCKMSHFKNFTNKILYLFFNTFGNQIITFNLETWHWNINVFSVLNSSIWFEQFVLNWFTYSVSKLKIPLKFETRFSLK